jgi:hypothetical protein
MRLEQQVGRDRGGDFVRREIGKTRLRMVADVRIRPTIKSALLNTDQIIGWQIVAQTITFLHQCPKVPSLRLE